MNDLRDKFPIGMHVLAVDDDRTCLKILKKLLLKCQYHEAVPKKILELMNVEKLTWRNVASHLQRYRLYQKRNSYRENQEAYTAAMLGSSSDTSYSRMPSLDGSTQFHNNPFGSFPSGGSMSSNVNQRFNTPSNVNMHGFSSSGISQLNHTHDQLLPNSRGITVSPPNIQNMTNKLPDYYKPKVTMSCTNNALILESNPQEKQVAEGYKNWIACTTSFNHFCYIFSSCFYL